MDVGYSDHAESPRNHHPQLVMNNINLFPADVSRRAFLGQAGLGTMGLASLLNPALMAADRPEIDKWPGVLKQLHHKLEYLCY